MNSFIPLVALDSKGIGSWLIENFGYLLIVVIFLAMLNGGRKGETAENSTRILNVILALGVLAIAADVTGVSAAISNIIFA